jgi:predicted nuclease with TOPRIM domain
MSNPSNNALQTVLEMVEERPEVSTVTSLPERSERTHDRRERLTRALAEIREMDETTATLKGVVDAQAQRIGELEAMVAFLDKRCEQLDADRMSYAKQCIELATQAETIWHAAEKAVGIARNARDLGLTPKQ